MCTNLIPPSPDAEVWYRYQDSLRSSGYIDDFESMVGPSQVVVTLYEYRVLKHTPKGVWLEHWDGKKFVLKEARRRFAAPTVAEAKRDFIARKNRQIGIYSARIETAEKALTIINKKGYFE